MSNRLLQKDRLPAPYGSLINREEPVSFRFEGVNFKGYEGDCIASALASQNQWILSRSFKYHRPRGALTMAGQDANTLVQLPSDPNVLADREPIREGLEVTAQNVNGSLENDRDAFMDKLGRFMPVGFYYRTFMGPTRNSWLKLWEPIIRAKAGLGIVDTDASPKHYEKKNLFCDLLVVGAGPAGLSAAIRAAEQGADVILVDENRQLGGSLTYARFDAAGETAAATLGDLVARADDLDNLRIMKEAVCNGWFEDNWLPVIQNDYLYKVRASEVILAGGSLEQPAQFRNNDLPGIMLGSAVQRLMRHFAVKPGSKAVVLAANRDGYRVALDLLDAGVDVSHLVDPRDGGSGGDLERALASKGVDIRKGARIIEADGGRGNRHVKQVLAAPNGSANGDWIACDLLAVSVGFAPMWQLPLQSGGKMGYDGKSAQFTIANLPENLELAGSVDGWFDLDAVKATGRIAAEKALKRLGHDVAETAAPEDSERLLANFEPPLEANPKGRDFVDFDEDLQVKDIVNAVKEGYRELELVKRFSTVGMGPSQGRHSALATARIVADATDREIDKVGVTTARPPFGPEKLGVLAGHHHMPERHTPLHSRLVSMGAKMMPVGAWRRPYYFGRSDNPEEIFHGEVNHVRNAVGALDVSTLGGLEVRGPDAGEFLNRIYTMAYAKQPVGRVRYCLMTSEMGTVVDDGVAYRLAEDVYYVTATTGAVARVYADMLFWNAQWRLDVDVLNVTAAWAGINITGPNAQKLLASMDSDIDFSAGGFNYLDGREGTVAGVPVRAMRIGFTGEISYELHCPQSFAVTLWDALFEAGKAFDLKPYGLEASRILRLEKGHIIIGQDTDALTTAEELGMDWAISKKKPIFIGKRAIEMRKDRPSQRKHVGFRLPKGTSVVPGESCLVLKDNHPVGHVTSVAYSPTLREYVGLVYVHVDDSETGTEITIKNRDGSLTRTQVTSVHFFDPENKRQEVQS